MIGMIINMKEVLIGIVIGVVIMCILFNFEDLKRSYTKRKRGKRYNRLAKGIPKRVVGLMHFDEIWSYRYNPFYIDGEIFTMSYGWIHCNDEVFVIKDSNGGEFRLSSTLASSYKTPDGKRHYVRRLQLKENRYKNTIPSRYVYVDSILEVY